MSVNRAARLHALVEELRRQGDRGTTCSRLSEEFGVTTRTIKRDIETLMMAGAAIEARSGPGGGYRLVGRATLPPVNFTVPQAVSIALALTAAGDAPFAPDGRAALAKLLDVMDEESRRKVAELGGRVWIRGDGGALTDSRRNRQAVEQGLEQSRVVSLHYVDGEGSETARAVEPHILAQDRGQWFLIGWCRQRDAVRWFRLDRMRRATLTNDHFTPRDSTVFGQPPEDARPVAHGR
ncbi:HTH domain protein [Rhodococcus erythropolis]|uniref:helix-turn-helix transcriptional regulator n=1 Tax=Rhodococcus erythropolis TaxID=1833 RepID=UPI000BB320CC|nr:HTH domain protein [Rhodococcus erythropolis]